MKNIEFAEEWATALESGEFKQGDGALCKDGFYCCLGVAEELLVRKGIINKKNHKNYVAYDIDEFGHGSYTSLSPKSMEYMGVASGNPVIGENTAMYYNDTLKYSFKQIAKLIRENIINGKRSE